MQSTPIFLTLYSDYIHVYLGLCSYSGLLDHAVMLPKDASRELIPALDNLLTKHSKTLNDCDFFAACQGPAPFTTLRVALATINGLAIATDKPLIGIDGLRVFLEEHYSPEHEYTIALLNAFAQDVYYGVYKKNSGFIEAGCLPIEKCLHHLQQLTNNAPFSLIGNGVALHQALIQATLPTCHISESLPLYASFAAICTAAQQQWQERDNLHQQLLPLYLKNLSI
ncbi:MAG: tRNA (adenosine(37)-N6)-threonylcarbamoyltransferase complex dimerization subunit type 1 TsaB [Candidatus Babeliaceae bacterium]|jgi:tRNA threonylcarbamoyladenosine biosynthesis protein TsaB